MTQTEALKLALEALKRVLPHAKESMTNTELDIDILDAHAAITAIEARLSPQNELEAHWNEVRASYGARQAALEAKDAPVAHSVVAGALFDFMGWLTSREKRLILSSVDEASPAVEAITEFAKKRNLSLKYAEVGYWMEFLSTPPQRKPLTDEEIHQIFIANSVVVDNGNAYMVAGLRALNITRAIEAAHGIK